MIKESGDLIGLEHILNNQLKVSVINDKKTLSSKSSIIPSLGITSNVTITSQTNPNPPLVSLRMLGCDLANLVLSNQQ